MLFYFCKESVLNKALYWSDQNNSFVSPTGNDIFSLKTFQFSRHNTHFNTNAKVVWENGCLTDYQKSPRVSAVSALSYIRTINMTEFGKFATAYWTGCLFTRLSTHVRPGVLSPSRAGDDVTAAVVAHAQSSMAVHMTSRWRSCRATHEDTRRNGRRGSSKWSEKSQADEPSTQKLV